MEQKMVKSSPRLDWNENGMTALETAVILIAFVVSAAVFAFAILSAGTFSTERGKESVLAGLNEVQSAVELHGQVVAIANTTGMTGTIASLVFTLDNALNGSPVPIDPAGAGTDKIIIKYYDETQINHDLTWTAVWLISDGDNLLENGEQVEITIANLNTQLTHPLSANTQFTLEIVPPRGSTLNLTRTTPPVVDQVFTLE